jgi:galactose-1-phosphate uridylyltransferase
MIKFERVIGEAKLLNPLKNFELDSQPIETRLDPLTGQTATVRTGRKEWSWVFKADEKLIDEIVQGSQERCFFCPGKVEQATPKFPPEIFPEGRIRLGETTLFPNLFAQKECSAIAVLSKRHFLRLNEFNEEMLANGLKAAQIYLESVYHLGAIKHAEIGFNYLFPAGSSVLHPHLQILGSRIPNYLTKVLLERSYEYYREHSVNYWEELIETEKQSHERYVGAIGATEWYLPFAPLLENEIHAQVRNKSNFLEFNEADWESLAEGISRVLKYYHDEGFLSFNIAIYSGPLGEKLGYFWAGLIMAVRSGVQACPVNDAWFSQVLFRDGFSLEFPEKIADELQKYF